MKGFYNLMDIYEMSDKCECTFIYFDRVDRAYRHRVPLLSKTGFSFRLLALLGVVTMTFWNSAATPFADRQIQSISHFILPA